MRSELQVKKRVWGIILLRALNEWPLAIIGKDPRRHASAIHGRRIIDNHLERMESLLRESLTSSTREDRFKKVDKS